LTKKVVDSTRGYLKVNTESCLRILTTAMMAVEKARYVTCVAVELGV
jgi:hypothetical protein